MVLPEPTSPPPTRLPGWPAMLAASAAVAALAAAFTFVPWLHAHGMYLRHGVRFEGEWWRVLTSMWVHLGWKHYLADVAATVGLLLLAGRVARIREMLAVLVICGLVAQVALLRMPAVGWYGGLSGAAHGLALWTALRLLQEAGWPRVIGVVIAVVVLGKVWTEQSWLAALVFDPSWGFNVARGAHAAGAMAGLGCWLLQEWWWRRQ